MLTWFWFQLPFYTFGFHRLSLQKSVNELRFRFKTLLKILYNDIILLQQQNIFARGSNNQEFYFELFTMAIIWKLFGWGFQKIESKWRRVICCAIMVHKGICNMLRLVYTGYCINVCNMRSVSVGEKFFLCWLMKHVWTLGIKIEMSLNFSLENLG